MDLDNFFESHRQQRKKTQTKQQQLDFTPDPGKIQTRIQQMTNIFEQNEGAYTRYVKKGPGYARRKRRVRNNFMRNVLYNCFRKFEGGDPVDFDKEFLVKIEEEFYSDDEEIKLSEEQQNELDQLNDLLELAELKRKPAKIEEAKKKIKEFNDKIMENAKESSSEEENENELEELVCDNCGNATVIEEKGVFVCNLCGMVQGVAFKQSYQQQGNISGTKHMGKTGLIVDKFSEERFKQRTLKLIDMYTDCMAAAEDPAMSFINESLLDSMIEGIWSMMKKNRTESFEFCKIELIKMNITQLKRSRSHNIKKNVNYLKECLEVKKNVNYLVDVSDERKNLEDCLKSKFDKDEKEAFEMIKELVEDEIDAEFTLKISAIARHVLLTLREVKTKEADAIIEECGMKFIKYSKVYNLLKKVRGI